MLLCCTMGTCVTWGLQAGDDSRASIWKKIVGSIIGGFVCLLVKKLHGRRRYFGMVRKELDFFCYDILFLQEHR